MFWFNEEHRIRMMFSERAWNTIHEDMQVFEVQTMSGFVNTVFHNYREMSKASIAIYLRKKREELREKLCNENIDEEVADRVIERLIIIERDELLKQMVNYKKAKSVTRVYTINKDNVEYIEECEEADYYQDSVSDYIKCVIEEYCSLPFLERERIYHKEIYDVIEEACEIRRSLKVKTMVGDKRVVFNVLPYKIVTDSMNSQAYLVCWTREEGADNTERTIASFAMRRMSQKPSRSTKFHVTVEQIKEIEDKISNHAVPYLLGEEKEVKVRFSQSGKRLLMNKLYMRPTIITEVPEEDAYIFRCTDYQAMSYFMAFGENAEIISPGEIRDKMLKRLKKAVQMYGD